MSTLQEIVINEKPEEVLLILARTEKGMPLPMIDRLFNRGDWSYSYDSSELHIIIKKMCDEGLIIYHNCSLIRGPNWREPQFMTEKDISSIEV